MTTRRVVLLAHRLAPAAPTGTTRYAFELSAALGRAGSDTRYVLASLAERTPPMTEPDVPVERVAGRRRVVQAGWYSVGRPRLESRLAPADLVHMCSPFAPVPTRAPVVYTVHDLMPMMEPAWFPRSVRLRFRRVMAAVRDAAHVVTDAECVARDVHERLAVPRERITTVQLAPAPNFLRPIDPTERVHVRAAHGVPDRYFIAVGALSGRKNLGVVVEALRAVPDHMLVLAGPTGHGAETVLEEIRRTGLEARVRVTGFLRDAELPALVADATALVHPATYEGFGFPPLEAMCVGTPVIASNGGSLPEVVGDAGMLVAPDDPEAWAAAMTRLAGDDVERARLAAAGRERAASFSWTRAAEETAAVHHRVLGG